MVEEKKQSSQEPEEIPKFGTAKTIGEMASDKDQYESESEIIDTKGVDIDQELMWKERMRSDIYFQKYICDELRKELKVNDSTKGLMGLKPEERDAEIIARNARVEQIERIFGYYMDVDNATIEHMMETHSKADIAKSHGIMKKEG